MSTHAVATTVDYHRRRRLPLAAVSDNVPSRAPVTPAVPARTTPHQALLDIGNDDDDDDDDDVNANDIHDGASASHSMHLPAMARRAHIARARRQHTSALSGPAAGLADEADAGATTAAGAAAASGGRKRRVNDDAASYDEAVGSSSDQPVHYGNNRSDRQPRRQPLTAKSGVTAAEALEYLANLNPFGVTTQGGLGKQKIPELVPVETATSAPSSANPAPTTPTTTVPATAGLSAKATGLIVFSTSTADQYNDARMNLVRRRAELVRDKKTEATENKPPDGWNEASSTIEVEFAEDVASRAGSSFADLVWRPKPPTEILEIDWTPDDELSTNFRDFELNGLGDTPTNRMVRVKAALDYKKEYVKKPPTMAAAPKAIHVSPQLRAACRAANAHIVRAAPQLRNVPDEDFMGKHAMRATYIELVASLWRSATMLSRTTGRATDYDKNHARIQESLYYFRNVQPSDLQTTTAATGNNNNSIYDMAAAANLHRLVGFAHPHNGNRNNALP